MPSYSDGLDVRVTFYLPTGNPMYNGQYPYVGAAACSWDFPLGTQLQFTKDGFVVTCLDRGHLGRTGWVDIFAPYWWWGNREVARLYGDYAEVTILRWGWRE